MVVFRAESVVMGGQTNPCVSESDPCSCFCQPPQGDFDTSIDSFLGGGGVGFLLFCERTLR